MVFLANVCTRHGMAAAARCKRMPRAPRNGYVIAPKTDHGMRARFACRDGYTLNGNDVIECSYGNWSGEIPLCDEGEAGLARPRQAAAMRQRSGGRPTRGPGPFSRRFFTPPHVATTHCHFENEIFKISWTCGLLDNSRDLK